jgi:hypothetical protein
VIEPTQGSPPTKRRRWLIVAFVLVLVSLCSWWCWPRGDARFVGKWTDSREVGVFEFRSSGVVYWTNPQIGRPTGWASWSVKDNSLLTGQPLDGQTGVLHRSLYKAWGDLTGQQWLQYGFFGGPLRIIEWKPESILLAEVDADTGETHDRFTLTRISE